MSVFNYCIEFCIVIVSKCCNVPAEKRYLSLFIFLSVWILKTDTHKCSQTVKYFIICVKFQKNFWYLYSIFLCDINLVTVFQYGVPLHTIGHVLGALDEIAREDINQYVRTTITSDDAEAKKWLEILYEDFPNSANYGLPFDPASLMLGLHEVWCNSEHS